MSSRWTHAQCAGCWHREQGDRRPLTLALEARQMESCCFCGQQTYAGIYVRADPMVLACRGERCAVKETG
jgi:hypothetical protein